MTTDKFSISISEVKKTLDIGKNPWYTEVLIFIYPGIFLVILGFLIFLLNGLLYLVNLPFKKKIKTADDLKWEKLFNTPRLTIYRSDPANFLLTEKEMQWLDEDPIYKVKTSPTLADIENKFFTDFNAKFCNGIMLQSIKPSGDKDDFKIKSELLYVATDTQISTVLKEFDYYYLTSRTNQNTLTINGKDESGSTIELIIQDNEINNGS